jgi:hypothetical protein
MARGTTFETLNSRKTTEAVAFDPLKQVRSESVSDAGFQGPLGSALSTESLHQGSSTEWEKTLLFFS